MTQTTRMDTQAIIDMTIDQPNQEIINIRLTQTDEKPQEDTPDVIAIGKSNYLIKPLV